MTDTQTLDCYLYQKPITFAITRSHKILQGFEIHGSAAPRKELRMAGKKKKKRKNRPYLEKKNPQKKKTGDSEC